jgi:hypothetical protein
MAAKKATSKQEVSPVSVKLVPSGKPVPGAVIDVKTGMTQNKKFAITVRPAKGRPVLIAVHL